MPRIISIARSSPTRSSLFRCWDTSAGRADLAVSVAIWRVTFRSLSMRRPGSPGVRSPRVAGSPLSSQGFDGPDEPTTWAVTLDADDGRVRVLAPSALADAGRVA